MSTFDSIILFTGLVFVESVLLFWIAGLVYYASNRVIRAYRCELGSWIISRAIEEYSHNHPEVIAEWKRKNPKDTAK